MNSSRRQLGVHILPQPDDNTCGPTSLHAVYNYFGLDLNLKEVIESVKHLHNGGTLAVYLGLNALEKDFDATIYTFNVKMFDPTWFSLSSAGLRKKIKEQLAYKRSKRFNAIAHAYMEFLKNGGQIKMENLTTEFLQSFFDRKTPILTGLSATYLYQSKREYGNSRGQSVYDDLKGEPMGHFVVLMGRSENGNILVADPYIGNPISRDNYYEVTPARLINSILLGILTYDANLLIITPK